ncbi:VOC family protein [Rhodococcus sp. NPDC057297]|uniref:VOC family protein n=1 Tax=Rhodococcus sp. NPDC057297 TaxID=3346090 RepID=UPI0036274214
MTLDSVVAILPVEDFAEARAWYTTLFGREPDIEPIEDTAEWQIAENAWVQVCVDIASAGRTSVVIGVRDIDAHATALTAAGITVGEIQEYPGVVKTVAAPDPAGNTVTFVQELTQG